MKDQFHVKWTPHNLFPEYKSKEKYLHIENAFSRTQNNYNKVHFLLNLTAAISKQNSNSS